MQIGLILHGRTDRKNSFNKLLQRYADIISGEPLRVIPTRYPAEAIEIARQLANEGYTHIIAVGGDGSFNEIINGIMLSNNRACVASLLPYGTANDWSRTWPCSGTLPDLFRRIHSGQTKYVDIGYLEFETQRSKYFVNIADTGLGAQVVREVNQSAKWPGPELTYFLSILKIFRTYRNKYVHCSTPDWKWSGKCKSIIVANGRSFGNGLLIAPDADPTDGLLQLVIIGDVSLIDYLRYLPDLKKGRLIRHPQVIYKQVSSVCLSTDERDEIEADGESMGELPVKISLLPNALRLLA